MKPESTSPPGSGLSRHAFIAGLASFRAAYTAKTAQVSFEKELADGGLMAGLQDEALLAVCHPMSPEETIQRHRGACELKPFDAIQTFGRRVWSAERPRDLPLQVNRIEDLSPAVRRRDFPTSPAGTARWAVPAGDRFGIARKGELAGTTGLVPYIDVTDEALTETAILHEIAHLLVDTGPVTQGHNQTWADAFAGLLQRHVSLLASSAWSMWWEWWSEKQIEKIAANPRWLVDGYVREVVRAQT